MRPTLRVLLPSLVLLFGAAPPRGQAPAGADEAPVTFAELGLTVVPPPLAERVYEDHPAGELRGKWLGKLGATSVEVKLITLPRAEQPIAEPEDVTDIVAGYVTKVPGARFRAVELLSGPYGHAPYAALAEGAQNAGTRVVARHVLLAGVLPEHGYYLWVALAGEPPEEARAAMRAWLAGAVRYAGEPRENEWSEEEAEARWIAAAPAELANKRELEKVIRTEHYIVLTNASGGKTFAKQMEENYRIVRKIFPFAEVEGRSLMPVFLFQLPEEYHAFCSKQFGWPLADAAKSKGVASGDFYATYYEAPTDPVHLHEATHQIFRNRLRLGGGGSWFQEGVAEFVEANPNDVRNFGKQGAKKGEYTPFEQFVQIQSMLYSASNDASGDSQAHRNYTQAASIITFLHDSKFGKEKFAECIEKLGTAPPGLESMNAVFLEVYGVDVRGIEAAWVEYWKKA